MHWLEQTKCFECKVKLDEALITIEHPERGITVRVCRDCLMMLKHQYPWIENDSVYVDGEHIGILRDFLEDDTDF